MIDKICTKCKIIKPAADFSKQSDMKTGLSSWCKECQKENYRNKREQKLAQKHEYYLRNIEKRREYNKEYSIKNKEKIKKQQKEYHMRNREKINLRNKAWQSENYDKVLKANNEWKKRKVKTDTTFYLRCRIKTLVKQAFKNKGYKRSYKVYSILGCSYDEFKTHIENNFTEGMSWENRGEWHIDHYIPLASAKNGADIIKLNHYKNLRPLWAIDNIKKSNKIPGLEGVK